MERTIIHLHYLPTDIHQYFGSLAGIFEIYSSEQLGITYGSLRNFGLNEKKVFSNENCIIRKGNLITKRGKRGKKI